MRPHIDIYVVLGLQGHKLHEMIMNLCRYHKCFMLVRDHNCFFMILS